jgi:cell division protein FtsB
LLVGAVLAVSTLFAGIIIVGSVACSRDALQKGLAGGSASTLDELLAELRTDKTRIDDTTDTMMKRIESFNASRKPGERQIQFSEIFYDNLSPDQRDVLNTLVTEEKDVSYKALLESIIKDRESIRGLQEKVLHLEQTLPDQFVIAKKGDSHHELATSYLVNTGGVDAEKAKTLLASVDQTDELVPGNKVWFFYDKERDSFRTYVTQGEAGQTPLVVRRALKRQLITQRDAAEAKVKSLEQTKADLEANKTRLETDIASLNGDVSALTDRRSQLESEVTGLKADNNSLETKVAGLSGDIAFRDNSLFYHAASERELKDTGALTTVFKRVKDVKGIHFTDSLDLRKSTTISLAPGAYGLDRIKGVRVLPEIYQEGRDFSVETSDDGSTAKVTILDPEIFRGKEVIVSVRG